jgi:hypothetical protein
VGAGVLGGRETLDRRMPLMGPYVMVLMFVGIGVLFTCLGCSGLAMLAIGVLVVWLAVPGRWR